MMKPSTTLPRRSSRNFAVWPGSGALTAQLPAPGSSTLGSTNRFYQKASGDSTRWNAPSPLYLERRGEMIRGKRGPGATDRLTQGRARPQGSMGRRVRDLLHSPNSCLGHPEPASCKAGQRGDAMRASAAFFVGIDVSKQQLDIAVRPSGESWTVAHEEASLSALVARLRDLAPTLIVLEATGGWEVTVTGALAAAALPVAVVNPRQVRDFARSSGRPAHSAAAPGPH